MNNLTQDVALVTRALSHIATFTCPLRECKFAPIDASTLDSRTFTLPFSYAPSIMQQVSDLLSLVCEHNHILYAPLMYNIETQEFSVPRIKYALDAQGEQVRTIDDPFPPFKWEATCE